MPNKPFNRNSLARAEALFRGSLPRALVDHDEKPVNRDRSAITIRERDRQEAEDALFLEKNAGYQDRNQHLTPPQCVQNMLALVYPSVPLYGPVHGQRTSQLAVYIAQVEGTTDGTDIEVLKIAGLVHDVGRREAAGHPDADTNRRSAEIADRFLRADPTATHQREVRERVCWLVAKHTTEWREPPVDPLARFLADADALEGARLGASEVARLYPRLLSPWCRLEKTQGTWRRKYGV